MEPDDPIEAAWEYLATAAYLGEDVRPLPHVTVYVAEAFHANRAVPILLGLFADSDSAHNALAEYALNDMLAGGWGPWWDDPVNRQLDLESLGPLDGQRATLAAIVDETIQNIGGLPSLVQYFNARSSEMLIVRPEKVQKARATPTAHSILTSRPVAEHL